MSVKQRTLKSEFSLNGKRLAHRETGDRDL